MGSETHGIILAVLDRCLDDKDITQLASSMRDKLYRKFQCACQTFCNDKSTYIIC